MENSVRYTYLWLFCFTGSHSVQGKILWRKEMAIHSSILAWRIPWTEESVGYNPWDHKESDTTEQVMFSLFTLANPLVWDTIWASGREPSCQSRRHKRHGFSPWVGKIPWRRKWQPTPVFFPGESHGQRGLAGVVHRYKVWDTIEVTACREAMLSQPEGWVLLTSSGRGQGWFHSAQDNHTQ